MKKLILLLTIVSSLTLASSCSQQGIQPADFEFTPESITVSHKGGISTISYTYRNPDAKAEFKAKSNAGWIYGFDSSKDGEISFITEVNKSDESRQTVVDVTCTAGNVTKSFLVIQKSAKDEGQGDITFGLKVVTEYDNALKYNVESEDGITYYTSVEEKGVLDSYDDINLFFKENLDRMKEAAGKEGISLEEYLKKNLHDRSRQDIICKNLKPGTEYYIYAYAMDYSGNPVSSISKIQAGTTSGGIIDASFDLDFEVKGPEVKMTIVPESNDFPYVFDIYPKKGLDGSKLVETYQKYIDELIVLYGQFGMTAEDIIKQIASIGPDSFSGEFNSDTQYIGFAIAITTSGRLNSEPTTEEFRTEAVGTSDNKIELTITKTETRSVHFKVNTTNNDKYVLGIGMASLWNGLSDNEIITSVINNTPDLSENALRGDIENRFNDLDPDTEYLVFAFGYYGGVPTTSLVKATCKTLEVSDSDVTFSLEYDKFFDGDEVALKYPQYYEAKGNAVLPTEVRTTGDVQGYLYHIFEGDWLDTGNPTDADIIQNLLQNGISSPSKVFYVPYGKVCTLLGFSIDNDGNYGKVFRKTLELNKEDASPVEEFSPESRAVSLCPAIEKRHRLIFACQHPEDDGPAKDIRNVFLIKRDIDRH